MIYYTFINDEAYAKSKNAHSCEHEAAMSLLRRAVKKEYGVSCLPEICKGEKGKPYFKNSGIYFNLSHAKGIAVCAISQSEIGVDCEADDRCSMSAAERIFSEEERSAFQKLAGKEKARFFTKLWTAKEAYGKALGTGVFSDLSGITLEGKEKIGEFYLKSYEINRGGKIFIITAAGKNYGVISSPPEEL